MKLFLHWLRWDLRRFRVMLRVWTLLVIGYTTFLGWLHLEILTIHPEWMAWSQPAALGLGVVQVFLLLHLFSTDPAVGTDCFWKTRPPGGIAVAGAKLVIALGFFVALPMLAWLVVNRLCVPPESVTNGWRGGSWTKFLWWSQSLLTGIMCLGAASVAHAWQIPLRVALGFVLAVVPVLGVILVAFELTFSELLRLVVENAVKSFTNPDLGGIFLLAGSLLLLLARWYRPWERGWRLLGVMLPFALFKLGPIRPETDLKSVTPPESANPAAGAGIRLGELILRNGLPTYSYPKAWAFDEKVKEALYEMKLQVSGLPGGLPTTAGWQTLRLTAPDGQVLEGKGQAMQSRKIRRSILGDPTILPVDNAIFDAKDAATFSRIPCRAEGTLRVMINRVETADWPLQPNGQLVTLFARYQLPALASDASPWHLEFDWIRLGPGQVIGGRLFRNSPEDGLDVSLSEDHVVTGFLVQQHRMKGHLDLHQESLDWHHFQKAVKMSNGMPMAGWTLNLQGQTSDGYVDIPVVLDPFILPGLPGDRRTQAELIRAVSWTASTPPEEIKSRLLTVLMYANESHQNVEDGTDLNRALEEKLNLLKREYLPLLLEIARSDLTSAAYAGRPGVFSADSPLQRRIAALVQPEDIDRLQTEPALLDFLRYVLKRAGHQVPEKALLKSPKEMSDQELEGWDRVYLGSFQQFKMLEEALRRGLPWSMKAILEIATTDLFNTYLMVNPTYLKSIIDCPQYAYLPSWLRTHGSTLIWDAARGKWVIMPSADPAPN